MDTQTVQNPLAAQILANPSEIRWLKPFMRQTLSTKQAASELGVSRQTMHYRVGRLLQAELLVVEHSQKRWGRDIRFYRASAQRYRIPPHLMDPRLMERMESGGFWEDWLQANLRQAKLVMEGLEVWLSQEGLAMWDFEVPVNLEEEPLLNNSLSNLWLDYPEALELRQKLLEVVLQYQGRKGSQRYLLRLGLAPLVLPPPGE